MRVVGREGDREQAALAAVVADQVANVEEGPRGLVPAAENRDLPELLDDEEELREAWRARHIGGVFESADALQRQATVALAG